MRNSTLHRLEGGEYSSDEGWQCGAGPGSDVDRNETHLRTTDSEATNRARTNMVAPNTLGTDCEATSLKRIAMVPMNTKMKRYSDNERKPGEIAGMSSNPISLSGALCSCRKYALNSFHLTTLKHRNMKS